MPVTCPRCIPAFAPRTLTSLGARCVPRPWFVPTRGQVGVNARPAKTLVFLQLAVGMHVVGLLLDGLTCIRFGGQHFLLLVLLLLFCDQMDARLSRKSGHRGCVTSFTQPLLNTNYQLEVQEENGC